MTDRPITYDDLWDQYAEGKLSTSVMRRLLEDDEVFRQWCIRKADEARKAQNSKLPISDEDTA